MMKVGEASASAERSLPCGKGTLLDRQKLQNAGAEVMPLSRGVDPSQQEGLRRLWEVVERERSHLERHLLDVVQSIPVFARLLETVDPEVQAEQQAQSRLRERAALVDGQWEEYLDSLHAQGVTYARLGIPFREWYRILGPYREVIEAAVVPEEGNARQVLTAMGALLDTAMAGIGSAYIEEKESLVREAEQRLGLYIDMFRSASVGMLMYRWEAPPDPASFRLITANPAATRFAGPQLLAGIDKTLGEVSSPALDTEIPGLYAKALETGEPQAWTRASGDGEEAQVYDGRCFSLGGGYLGVVFEDVTERRQMERALARYVRELERSNRELDDFAYVASHDLKAPLRDIDNLAKWIAEDSADALSEASARHLGLLSERIGRMERLLDDLLSYSRAGRIVSTPEPLSLAHLVDDAVNLAAVPEGFEVHVGGDDVHLEVPQAPLAQVLRNLIANAVKHHDRETGRIDVVLADGPELVCIEVRDDGPGIPVRFHDRVFRMFQTLRPRDEVEGSGMGLAIVKKLVEAHGGEVHVDGGEGRGTVVAFTWPKLFRSTVGGSR